MWSDAVREPVSQPQIHSLQVWMGGSSYWWYCEAAASKEVLASSDPLASAQRRWFSPDAVQISEVRPCGVTLTVSAKSALKHLL